MSDISDQDKELFRQATKGVKPLQNTKINLISQPQFKKYRPRAQEIEDEPAADIFSDFSMAESVTAEQSLAYARPGIQHTIMKKLKRGQYPIEAELDLHGATTAEARLSLSQFLVDCQLNQLRVICIIHGKGRRSQSEFPILKNKINSWLRQTDQVNAFCSAQPKDGGTGAVYVMLRNS